ncbi:membrane protein [Acrocarpospora corrugata]|uniref:Membrane protein n=1 Tax=Acrocarpospora corrugata TaxID=35763 RepID=A0A5M3W800_9ACTN|nr:YcnI family protein [Acrocarpospora corrugata]GES04112.1 membrane protein [Acrocarpospora corrugata]
MSILRRAIAVTAGATALTFGLALPALAHVTINPGSAEKGGFTKVAFRVPNERDDASTTKIEVSLPLDHPLPFVSVRPVPGWDVKVTESKLPAPVQSKYGEITEAVTKITWSGGKVEAGQFQEFEVSMGIMPDNVDQLIFPTTQTYSSGEVVKWADEPKTDGTEAEHPAPTLKLVAPTGDDSHGAAAAATPTAAAPSVVPIAQTGADSSTTSSDSTARLIGGVGVAVGVIGVGVAIVALRRRPTA